MRLRQWGRQFCFVLYLGRQTSLYIIHYTLINGVAFIIHFTLYIEMTIFSKIVQGEIPSYRCAENDEFYAFLDINPLAQGHTLVVPKREVDYFFDLTDEELSRMIVFAKRVAAAIRQAYPCRKVGMAVLGLEVNHAHIHLVPLQSEGDMDFRKAKLQLSAETMQQTADAILAAFQ